MVTNKQVKPDTKLEEFEARQIERARRRKLVQAEIRQEEDNDYVLDKFYENYMDRTILNGWDRIIGRKN